MHRTFHPFSPGDLSAWEPLDPIPNSTVKPRRAYDRVRSTHAKVGHRQATYSLYPPDSRGGCFLGLDLDGYFARYQRSSQLFCTEI